MSAFFALIPGEGASPQVLSRKSELGERPPHPNPLHSPSKTGVNALKASGEREQKDPHTFMPVRGVRRHLRGYCGGSTHTSLCLMRSMSFCGSNFT